MTIDFNKPFTDPFGQPVTDAKGQPQNIAKVLASLLFNATTLNGKPLTPEQKLMAYDIATRMAANGTDYTVEEAQFIKQMAAQQFAAGAYGAIHTLIEHPLR